MTPKQFTKIRKGLFRSQLQAAEALGVCQAAISHWELGRRPVPETIVKLLEYLERYPQNSK